MKSIRHLLVVALLATPAFAEPRQETLTLPRAIEIAEAIHAKTGSTSWRPPR